MPRGWGVLLNGVAITENCDVDASEFCPEGTTLIVGLDGPPDGLGVPGRRVEDVEYPQRDGVEHFRDWYEPRIVTLQVTVTQDPDGDCGGCENVREAVRAISQAWSRACDDDELVIFTDCDGDIDPDQESGYASELYGPFAMVGRARVASLEWVRGHKAATLTLRFDGVDQLLYRLDECGEPGSGEVCVEVEGYTDPLHTLLEGTADSFWPMHSEPGATVFPDVVAGRLGEVAVGGGFTTYPTADNHPFYEAFRSASTGTTVRFHWIPTGDAFTLAFLIDTTGATTTSGWTASDPLIRSWWGAPTPAGEGLLRYGSTISKLGTGDSGDVDTNPAGRTLVIISQPATTGDGTITTCWPGGGDSATFTRQGIGSQPRLEFQPIRSYGVYLSDAAVWDSELSSGDVTALCNAYAATPPTFDPVDVCGTECVPFTVTIDFGGESLSENEEWVLNLGNSFIGLTGEVSGEVTIDTRTGAATTSDGTPVTSRIIGDPFLNLQPGDNTLYWSSGAVDPDVSICYRCAVNQA